MTEKTKITKRPDTVYGAVRQSRSRRPIDDGALKDAIADFERFREGRQALENRIVEDELWYKRRHWDVMRTSRRGRGAEPTSAWLFNTLMNK
ncbi:MAG: hypothetical protein J6Q16_04060, partial [Clostridia bacterium]|nr:hypothetical protein [Clostridia bacterium]